MLSVAATDSRDLLAGFSNRGAATVHLAAPGVNIASTTPGAQYAYLSGTSMATPHVSGAAALVLSRCTLTTAALRTDLLSTLDVLGSLAGLVSSSGRLNADRALRACALPAAPAGVTATRGDARVTLTWNAVSGAASYRVKRATVSGGPYTTIASGISTTSYLDASGLTNGVTYYYIVTAVNAAGEGPASSQVSATPLAVKPPAPATLKATPGNARVALTWPASAGADSYNVKRSLVSGGPFVTIANVTATSYLDLNVTNGTAYYYRVTALNEAGESALSKKVGAIPAPVPLAPTGLSATAGASPGVVNLSWTGSAWATSYQGQARHRERRPLLERQEGARDLVFGDGDERPPLLLRRHCGERLRRERALGPGHDRRAVEASGVWPLASRKNPAPEATCQGREARGQREKARCRHRAFKNNPGSDLLSHAPTHTVPSAVAGLTSVFGMGTGGTLPL